MHIWGTPQQYSFVPSELLICVCTLAKERNSEREKLGVVLKRE